MTVTSQLAPVSPAMVAAMIDEARERKYLEGVIGMRGVPDRASETDFDHRGTLVRVRSAESALAVREALAEHRSGDWMVILTDRSEEDLGPGLLSHLVWHRLRRPDPWEAVRHRFSATGIDPSLATGPGNRDLATALLTAMPPGGWPAAPAGVLTRAHALNSVARAWLGLTEDASDVLAVLHWSMRPTSVTGIGELRAQFGDILADATLGWVADNAGAAAQPVRALLNRGDLGDIVPVGLVLGLLTDSARLTTEEQHEAKIALVRLEALWNGQVPHAAALNALGAAATALVADLARDERQTAHVNRVLQKADMRLEQLQTPQLNVYSDLLPRGFGARLARLADALRVGVRELDEDAGPARAEVTTAVERAWTVVQQHRLGQLPGAEVSAFEAAVRLWRWLQTPSSPENASLGELTRHHLEHDAWADAAINDVAVGVEGPELSEALNLVVTRARARRHEQEAAFAAALAAATESARGVTEGGLPSEAGTVWHLESLLPKVVLPMAKKAPVLLLVMDGMSAATATEILADAVERLAWLEAAPPGSDGAHRGAALSVLPSLTEVSRASLLCGRLTRGQQDAERAGYAELTERGHRVKGQLFHKKAVDSTVPGWAVADGVGTALDDTEGTPLVTVVLNTIDDALDRSDPVGTTWTADAVKHLEPLLARARAAGRTVVMTADHGHIVERRLGTQRSYSDISSGRSRAVTGTVEDGEVEVSGPRVLADGNRAVLAVSETLRYGPLKAGYHGGASAAEVVVPVAVLLPDEDSNPLGLPLLPPQAPHWWLAAEGTSTVAAGAITPQPTGITALTAKRKQNAPDLGPTLFDDVHSAPTATAPTAPSLGRAVVASSVYGTQRSVAGRVLVTEQQIALLVDALAAAGSNRLPMAMAASLLGVNEVRLRGALAQVQQLLNVEGYPVIQVDLDGRAVVLNPRLLREQFEVA